MSNTTALVVMHAVHWVCAAAVGSSCAFNGHPWIALTCVVLPLVLGGMSIGPRKEAP